MHCGKEEDRPCEEALSEDAFHLEGVEKGKSAVLCVRRGGREWPGVLPFPGSPPSSLCADVYSELDDELDILDSCSSSSSSPLKESTFSKLAGQVRHCGAAVVGPWEMG